jgi:hypothetical protein
MNNTHALLYGGYTECLAWNQCENVFHNDIFIHDAHNPARIKWTKVQNLGSVAPIPRSIDCAFYTNNKLYIYGGANFTAKFEEDETFFYNDTWVFSFATQTWQSLGTSPAGKRGGGGCDLIDASTGLITHGALGHDNIHLNDTWTWNLVNNQWNQLTTSATRPESRFQLEFAKIPGTSRFLLAHGQFAIASPPIIVNVFKTDVWVFNPANGNWQELTVENVPQPVHNVAGYALTSDRWLLMTAGDAGLANKTLAQTCPLPLRCVFKAAPTNTNYFLRLKLDQQPLKAVWEEESQFDHSIPPVRKPAMVILEPYVYFVGGMGWDGVHGVGEIQNPYTWSIRLKNNKF